MIFLYLVAALTGIITLAISLLPGPDFLALPEAAIDAVATAGHVGGWLLGLAGADVKAALLVALPIIVGVKITAFGWTVLRHWRPPGLARTL